MEAVTSTTLEAFLRRLGERSSCTGAFYLLGGSALCLLGNPRTTADVDYTFEADTGSVEEFEATLAELATEMRLDVEAVPLDVFIRLRAPAPPRPRRAPPQRSASNAKRGRDKGTHSNAFPFNTLLLAPTEQQSTPGAVRDKAQHIRAA